MCENGRCINMNGMFQCICDPGFSASADLSECIGKLFFCGLDHEDQLMHSCAFIVFTRCASPLYNLH